MEKTKTIKQAAEEYEPQVTKNISELDRVGVALLLKMDTGKKINDKGEEETYTYQYFEQDGEKWRMPNSVIKQLKDHIETNPNMEYFKVKKEGAGLQTKYTVVPIMDSPKVESTQQV